MTAPSQRQSVPQLLRRAAQQQGGNISCIDAATGAKYTYAESLNRVQRLAGGLHRELGLSSGGRVAVLSLNSAMYYELYFAVPWAGGVVVPLNIRLAPPEIMAILEDSSAELLVVDQAFKHVVDALGEALPSTVKKVVLCGGNDSGDSGLSATFCRYEDLVEKGTALERCLSSEGDGVYGLFYTGGTTGKAKGVMLSHGSILLNAFWNVSCAGFNEKTVYLHCAPMFHLADAQMTFAGTMGCSTHVFLPKFTPPDTLKAIDEYNVTKAVLVPIMIQFCLSMPNVSSFKLSSLDSIIYGGSPMAPSILELALKYFPNAAFSQGYGMTECGPAISLLSTEYHVKDNPKLASAGKPVPFAEVSYHRVRRCRLLMKLHIQVIIADEDGKELPRGKVGEILVRGPHTMIGYWQMPEATEKALKGGWMHTGDGGYMDEDGFIFICDRIKDMIISGGENVYSAEVEKAVQAFPGVGMAAVIGTPDPKYGELVTAVVTLKPGADKSTVTLEKMKEHCKSLIAGYKCPRKLVIKDKFPLSGAGKILKHEIRKEFWENAEQSKIYGKGDKTSSYS